MKAIALVPQAILQSPVWQALVDACAKYGCKLDSYNVTKSTEKYSELFRTNKNVVTWNCQMTPAWMKQWGGNVLYVENSLLCQRAGIFVDNGGFFTASNLYRKRTWEDDYKVDLNEFTEKNFGWKAMSGGDPNGSVLVCLQYANDSNLKQEFPQGVPYKDKIEAALVVVSKYLPQVPAVIRPHPRSLEEWVKKYDSYLKKGLIRDDWEMDWSKPFNEVLPKHSAMVAVNSTCISEACTLGIPVASLGLGCFSDSGSTLECGKRPDRLQKLFNEPANLQAQEKYTKAILGRHFLPYSTTDALWNTELQSWLANLKKN